MLVAKVLLEVCSSICTESNVICQNGADVVFSVELEFMNFRTPTADGYHMPGGAANIAAYLEMHSPRGLQTISNGMFGYSVTRPAMNKRFFRELFDQAGQFDCAIEGLHPESGPGVVEVVCFAPLQSALCSS